MQNITIITDTDSSILFDLPVTASESFPEGEITVIDSASLSIGSGYMALAAAEAATQGALVSEIISLTTDIRDRMHLFAALSSLKYLVMGGRVSNLAAGVATIFDVKPILTIRDGKLELLERVRTQKKTWERVIELSTSKAGDRPIEKNVYPACERPANGKPI